MLEIEIIETNIIEGGVEVFARAWKDKEQIGFGEDGSVDIERFRIFNPPILVPDKNGEILREWIDEDNNIKRSRRYREDPEEALLQDIESTIRVKKQVFGDSNIKTGKVGNTTTTARPQPSGGSDSFDARAIMDGSNTWAGARDSTNADSVNNHDNEHSYVITQRSGGRYYVRRSWFLFDTSGIADGDTISSAVITFYGSGRSTTNSLGTTMDIVEASPAGTDNLVATDFDNVSDVVFGEIDMNDWDTTDGNTNDFTLNANGIANITKTGTSKFAMRTGHDVDNSAPSGTENATAGGYYSDQAGTTNDPKIVIEHSGGGGGGFVPTPMLHMLQVTGGII